MKIVTITMILLIAPISSIASEMLCPPLPPLPKEADDLRMTEEEFTKERFLSSLAYFENDLPNKLNTSKETKELTNRSIFWISYRNGLKFIEGYMLKQEALLKGGAEKKAFCEFIVGSEYVD